MIVLEILRRCFVALVVILTVSGFAGAILAIILAWGGDFDQLGQELPDGDDATGAGVSNPFHVERG